MQLENANLWFLGAVALLRSLTCGFLVLLGRLGRHSHCFAYRHCLVLSLFVFGRLEMEWRLMPAFLRLGIIILGEEAFTRCLLRQAKLMRIADILRHVLVLVQRRIGVQDGQL